MQRFALSAYLYLTISRSVRVNWFLPETIINFMKPLRCRQTRGVQKEPPRRDGSLRLLRIRTLLHRTVEQQLAQRDRRAIQVPLEYRAA